MVWRPSTGRTSYGPRLALSRAGGLAAVAGCCMPFVWVVVTMSSLSS